MSFIIEDTQLTIYKSCQRLNNGGLLSVEKKINPLEEYWIQRAQQVLMTLPLSGQLSLNDIRTELGNSQGDNSLRNMSSQAGFSTPDTVSEFYGYTHNTSSLVTWTRIIDDSPNWSITSTQYRENAGIWTTFSTATRTNTVDGTVGYRFTLNITTSAGGDIRCGSSNGANDLGSAGNGGSGTITWTLDGISTTGSNMYFNDTVV